MATKKKAAASGGATSRAPARKASDAKTLERLVGLGEAVSSESIGGRDPFVDIPTRALSNTTWNRQRRILQMGDASQRRNLFNLGQARKFMQTLLHRERLQGTDRAGQDALACDRCTTRPFTRSPAPRRRPSRDQEESDPIIEDLEVAMDALREELHVFANEARQGRRQPHHHRQRRRDRLRRMGTGGYAIPSIVEPSVIRFEQVRREVHSACREGHGVGPLQRGPLLGEAQLHPHRRRRPAAARRAPTASPHARGAGAAGLLPARLRPVGALHLLRHQAGLDQPRLREPAHGDSRGEVHRHPRRRLPAVRPLRRREDRPQRPRHRPREADRRLPVVRRQAPGRRRSSACLRNGFKMEVESLITKGISYVTETYVPQKLSEKDWIE